MGVRRPVGRHRAEDGELAFLATLLATFLARALLVLGFLLARLLVLAFVGRRELEGLFGRRLFGGLGRGRGRRLGHAQRLRGGLGDGAHLAVGADEHHRVRLDADHLALDLALRVWITTFLPWTAFHDESGTFDRVGADVSGADVSGGGPPASAGASAVAVGR